MLGLFLSLLFNDDPKNTWGLELQSFHVSEVVAFQAAETSRGFPKDYSEL
jgi:hypothetical protein